MPGQELDQVHDLDWTSQLLQMILYLHDAADIPGHQKFGSRVSNGLSFGLAQLVGDFRLIDVKGPG